MGEGAAYSYAFVLPVEESHLGSDAWAKRVLPETQFSAIFNLNNNAF